MFPMILLLLSATSEFFIEMYIKILPCANCCKNIVYCLEKLHIYLIGSLPISLKKSH